MKTYFVTRPTGFFFVRVAGATLSLMLHTVLAAISHHIASRSHSLLETVRLTKLAKAAWLNHEAIW